MKHITLAAAFLALVGQAEAASEFDESNFNILCQSDKQHQEICGVAVQYSYDLFTSWLAECVTTVARPTARTLDCVKAKAAAIGLH
jgi:hypothetical protein